jgi:hypothetical protein
MRKSLIALAALASVTACGDADVSYTVVKTATHDCAKAPNASIEISDGTFVLTNTCDRILVKGGNNKITIEAVKRIDINGEKNVVEIDAVERVRVNGAGNTTRYKKGLSGTGLDVVTIGDHNTVIQGN